MKNHQAHTLIALALLLVASLLVTAADSARAARLALQIMPSWELYPALTEQGIRLGWAVAGAGRVNGDSYADILVGADKGGTDKQGWAGLFLGSNGGPQSMAVWSVSGERKGDLFGGALDSAGDVDGDGYDDIVVGAPNYEGVAPSDEAGEGAAYVYLGGESGPALTPAWKAEGDLQAAKFGAAVAGAGYVNGDEYADVIVGMPGFTNGDFINAGAAFVYFGSEDGLNPAYGWLDYGNQAGSQFGLEVNAAGDVNGDGYGDVLVGQPYYDNDIYLDAGAVYLYLGNQFSLSNVHAWSYIGYRGDDRLGTSAASAGDLNNDGCDDIAIGAPGYNEGGLLNTGKAYVFYGCQATLSGLNDVPDWEFTVEQAGANVGIDVSGAGDTNADGYAELLVGAHLYDDEQANEGTVYAFFGGPQGILSQPVWQVDGNKNDTYFGYAVDGAGDTNGDGFADVLIGAPTFRVNEVIKGAAFVYFGSTEAIIIHTHLPFIRK
jgi:hypothetical protein